MTEELKPDPIQAHRARFRAMSRDVRPSAAGRLGEHEPDRPEMAVLAAVSSLGGTVVGFLLAGQLFLVAWFIGAACVGGFVGWGARRIIVQE